MVVGEIWDERKEIETLIENIAEILLKDFNIEYVTISISKPGAIRDSQDVGIEITRKKNTKNKNQQQTKVE